MADGILQGIVFGFTPLSHHEFTDYHPHVVNT